MLGLNPNSDWADDGFHPNIHEEHQQQYPKVIVQNRSSGPMHESGQQGYCVRVRGIPFQESEYTTLKWFKDRGVNVKNGVLGVHFLYNDKRQWSGDAYIQLASEKDVEKALSHSEAEMQHRYLEIFRCTAEDMDVAMKRSPFYRLPNDYAVRLRGLEYRVTKDDIRDFFKGLDIASGLDGIYVVENQEGRPTGEAYVLFENKSSVEQAAQKHKEKLGQRYVEIFLASSTQIRDAQEFFPDEPPCRSLRGQMDGPPLPPRGGGIAGRYGPPAGYGAIGGGGYYDSYPPENDWPQHPDYRRSPEQEDYGVPQGRHPGYDPYAVESEFRLYMRGLPWTCSEQDIQKFFAPIRPSNIIKNMTNAGGFDGSAWVEFASVNDFEAAKRLHKTNMGHRYIELFTEEEMDSKRLRTNRESRELVRHRGGPPSPPREHARRSGGGGRARGSDRGRGGGQRRDGPRRGRGGGRGGRPPLNQRSTDTNIRSRGYVNTQPSPPSYGAIGVLSDRKPQYPLLNRISQPQSMQSDYGNFPATAQNSSMGSAYPVSSMAYDGGGFGTNGNFQSVPVSTYQNNNGMSTMPPSAGFGGGMASYQNQGFGNQQQQQFSMQGSQPLISMVPQQTFLQQPLQGNHLQYPGTVSYP